LQPSPTPAGVPVLLMSPGMSVMNWLMQLTSAGTSKIILSVLPFWHRSPLTVSHSGSAPTG
jgi:hypothetical protein